MKQEKHLLEFGPFQVDPVERTLLRDGAPISLPPKAFDTLLVLIENSGSVVNKGDLLNQVWPATFVEGRITLPSTFRCCVRCSAMIAMRSTIFKPLHGEDIAFAARSERLAMVKAHQNLEIRGRMPYLYCLSIPKQKRQPSRKPPRRRSQR